MQIDDDFALHKGAFADIRLASNIGAVNRVVDLSQGDVSLPELGDGTMLSGSQTDNPVDFDLAVSTLTPTFGPTSGGCSGPRRVADRARRGLRPDAPPQRDRR